MFNDESGRWKRGLEILSPIGMKKVLLTEPIRPEGITLLKNEVEITIAQNRDESAVAAIIGEYDAVITRTTRITKEIIERGEKLAVIGRHGAGLDIVEMDWATQFGICVVHTPAANARSVAEYVVGLMLASARMIIPADYAQRVNRDFSTRNSFMGHDLENRTVGIVGMGRIGRYLAKMCKFGFDMKVLGYDPYVKAEDLQAIGVEKVNDIGEIFRASDFVSLNCPLTEEVRGIVDHTMLSTMKPNAYLINCARGPIVNETALKDALDSGIIRGAALDVFEVEPPLNDNALFDAPNLIATPHIATMTHESMDLMSITVAQGVLSALKGDKPQFLANPTVWENRRR